MQCGEVWLFNLDPTFGSEIKKTRPAVIVSNNIINSHSSVVIVVPITDAKNKFSPIHIFLQKGTARLTKDSVAHCGQIRAVDKTRALKRLGIIPQSIMKNISQGLKLTLELT